MRYLWQKQQSDTHDVNDISLSRCSSFNWCEFIGQLWVQKQFISLYFGEISWNLLYVKSLRDIIELQELLLETIGDWLVWQKPIKFSTDFSLDINDDEKNGKLPFFKLFIHSIFDLNNKIKI